MRLLLILTAVMASLCLPATALAQNAGDEQYTEPSPGGNGDAEAAPADEAAQSAGPTPPRTGNPALLPAAAGYAPLLGGFAIRRQV